MCSSQHPGWHTCDIQSGTNFWMVLPATDVTFCLNTTFYMILLSQNYLRSKTYFIFLYFYYILKFSNAIWSRLLNKYSNDSRAIEQKITFFLLKSCEVWTFNFYKLHIFLMYEVLSLDILTDSFSSQLFARRTSLCHDGSIWTSLTDKYS